eukprot:jgi/Picre1/32341/NNA_007687.t1
MKDTDDSAILHLEVGDRLASSNTKGRGNRRKFPVVDSDQVRCSSGILGFVFGFGGYWLKERGRGVLKQALKGGLSSAKTFAVLGGLYTGVTCFMTRLRKKSDALNSGAAGCSTGLVLDGAAEGMLLQFRIVSCLDCSRIFWTMFLMGMQLPLKLVQGIVRETEAVAQRINHVS